MNDVFGWAPAGTAPENIQTKQEAFGKHGSDLLAQKKKEKEKNSHKLQWVFISISYFKLVNMCILTLFGANVFSLEAGGIPQRGRSGSSWL